jgi:hypothetical protein
MKKTFFALLCLILCIGLFSCGAREETPSSTESPGGNESPSEFDIDIKLVDLLNEIKKSPSGYNDKEVTILGTILLEDSTVFLVNYYKKHIGNTALDRYNFEMDLSSGEKIEIRILSEIELAVVETGDYAEIVGTVKIQDGNFYLDNCKCSIIATLQERS